MGRIVIIIGILPVILGIVIRKFFGERILRPYRDLSTSLTCRAFVDKLAAGAQWGIVVEEGNRTKLEEERLVLSRSLVEERDVISLSQVGLLFGLSLLGRRQPELLRWRAWALKFSWAFPSFTLLVVIFAVLVGHGKLAVPAAFFGLGVGSAVGFIAAWVEWQAAGLTSKLLMERAIIAREDDRIAITKSMRALASRRCVPGMLQFLFPEGSSKKTARKS